jgi:hypothetical protein
MKGIMKKNKSEPPADKKLIKRLHNKWCRTNGYKPQASSCKRIRHNDLTHYFIRDHKDLPRAYLASCEKFLHSLRNTLIKKKDAAALFKLQASSSPGYKPQASSATKKTQL